MIDNKIVIDMSEIQDILVQKLIADGFNYDLAYTLCQNHNFIDKISEKTTESILKDEDFTQKVMDKINQNYMSRIEALEAHIIKARNVNEEANKRLAELFRDMKKSQ